MARVVRGIEREIMGQGSREFNQSIDRKCRGGTAGALNILKSTLKSSVSSFGLPLGFLTGEFKDPHAEKTLFTTLTIIQRILLCSVALGCNGLLG